MPPSSSLGTEERILFFDRSRALFLKKFWDGQNAAGLDSTILSYTPLTYMSLVSFEEHWYAKYCKIAHD